MTFGLPWVRRVVDPAERPGTVRAVVEHTTCACQDKTPTVLETTRVVREDGTVCYEVILPAVRGTSPALPPTDPGSVT